MEEEVLITSVNPDTFETQEYNLSDQELLTVSELDTVFSSSTDYIEIAVYDENQNKIYSTPEGEVLTSYNVKEGDVLLNPEQNLRDLSFDIDTYYINYNFYRKRLNSDTSKKYFISEISSDRTEIRLDSNQIDQESIISSTNEFITYRDTQSYFVDFYLNFGSNQTIIANNVKLDNEEVLIKLYEPLPSQFDLKSTLWVVEEISTPQAYQVTFPFVVEIPDDFVYISGPNYNLNIKGQIGVSGQNFSYNTLINADVTSSVNQIKSLLAEKQININVNYEDFNEFIHFSSAKTRLENFYYKVGLIESASNQLSSSLGQITSDTVNTLAYSSSKAILTSQIEDTIRNFDGYEYFLYFNSGSSFSYPKSNTEPPYILQSTGSSEVLNWIGSADPDSPYFGGLALSASNYDQDNKDWLYWAIPEYLRTDPDNLKYELFVDMIGQHYDNIWLYTKDVTNKFDADNRLEYGISKDLVAEAIKDFGVKLYSNNFNTNDLYTAFLGLTPSGSLFPFPEMTGSLDAPTGYEYVDTRISASNEVIPLNDVNKRLYKRIYHNIPYLLKTKGTVAGLRALITSYGIPDTILRVNEFGGKDRNNSQDWDLEQNVFNYAFDTGTSATNFVSSSFDFNSDFLSPTTAPRTIQFRFKPASLPTASNNLPSSDIRYSQSLWSTNDGGNIVLEYTGSGFVTGSYSGSVVDPYDIYGTLKWIPANSDNPAISASVYLPFFNGDWWSAQVNYDGIESSSLYVANQIDGQIGFSGSDQANNFDTSYLDDATKAYLNYNSNITLNSVVYEPFSGSFQELRYWNTQISESNFFDYTVNPYSDEGNGINTTANQLMFRAALGTQLDTGSRTSIHPRVTGSATQVTQSFANDSSFYISNSNFVTNVEKIYQDQVVAGIKNRITDKVETEDIIIAEAPYGLAESSSVYATISTQNALSPLQSIQTISYTNQSYTPDVNYLEVAFSPQNQINDDINAQIGYFNIGDYIGDPRQISSSDRSYPDLDAIRDAYFDKYIKSYDVVDFVRLMKFFDNSLFKMIKDFTPARTSLASGVVVKQHILERNRQRQALASSSLHDYTGSIKPQSRNYNTGSGDVGQYEYVSGSSIYKFSGGTGGSFERYNGLEFSPSASILGLTNRFGITQSYSESIEYSIANSINNSGSFVGYRNIITSDQKEFYDGEFSGSNLEVTNLIANPGCTPYLSVSDKPIFFNPLFFNLHNGAVFQGTTLADEITLNVNYPAPGDAWIVSDQVQTNLSKVQYIKLSNSDVNGVFVGDYLDDSDTIKLVTPDANVVDNGGVVEYKITGVTTFANSVLLRISQTEGDNVVFTTGSNTYYPITSSTNGGSENWSLIARGGFTSSNTLSQSNDSLQQGNFINGAASSQRQYFWYYDGDINDAQSFFNTGSESVNLSNILSDPTKFEFGSYNPQRTSNIGWYFTCSIAYSASDLGTGNSLTGSKAQGIYHSASHYSGVGLTDQDFSFKTAAPATSSGIFKPSPKITNLNANIYKTAYNNLIPGDSGSAAGLTGGHPKISIPGTASIDFYYPSLTLGGTQRTLTPDTPIYSSLSGSAFPGGNDDFNSDLPNNFVNWSQSAEDRDGAIQLDDTDIKNFISLYYGRSPITIQYIELDDINFTITGSQPFTASLFERMYSGQTGDVTDRNLYFGFLEDGFPSVEDNGGHKVTVTGEGVNVRSLLYPGMISGIGTNIFLKIKPHGQDLSNMDYWITTFNADTLVHYTYSSTNYVTPSTFGGWNSTDFQGAISNKANFDFRYQSSGDKYPTINIVAQLRRTGSGIPEGGYIITSSNTLSAQKLYGGRTFEFTGSGDLGYILDVFQDDPLFATTTINNEDDMYFIAYSMSGYNDFGVSANKVFNVEFIENGDTGSKIIIEQRAESAGINTYDLTGSVLISQGNSDTPTSEGDIILSQNFIVDTSESIGRAELSGSFRYPFKYNDSFRMGVNVSKSFGAGLTITEYSMSIFPSSSIYAPLTLPPEYDYYKIPTSSGFIIPTYFGADVLPFNLALDCQPLLNNYNDIRQNTFIMDVDYTNVTGSITPVNQTQILENSAVKATVPDSNYTALKSINPRYNGVKSICKEINIWNVGDTGTFGKIPNVELKDAFFGYFNDLDDPYPNINGVTRVNLNYLIDEQGNALPPSLEGLGEDTLKAVFPINTQTKIAAQQGNRRYQILGESTNIAETLKYYSPIMYSQNSGDNYTNKIPLSGSGYISRYDNDDENSQIFAQFTAQGTASIDTSSPLQSVDYYLDPSEDVTLKQGSNYNPWTDGSNLSANYPSSEWTGQSVGDDLANAQVISLKHSIFTTLISETDRVGREMTFELHMYTGSQDPTTETAFNLRDITCKVYTEDGKVTSIGSVLDYGWFHIDNIVNWREVKKKYSYKFFNRNVNYWKTTRVPIPTGGIKVAIDGWEMWDTLYDRGLIRENKPKGYGGVIAMEWIIDANSGAYTIQVGDEINWRIIGAFLNSRGGYRQGYFFPDDYTGVKTPTKIQGQGVYDHLLAEANTAQAPFWVFTGSAGGGSSILDRSVLVMSSSNMNEAYGPSFLQSDLEYFPGRSEYFPGGIEPKTTSFDKIEYPLELLEGDEIRFGNNENYSYRITRVVPPDENIEGGKGRLKIFLNAPVDTSVNKDFFLVRRPIPNPNSIYLETPFPYQSLASASISTGISSPGASGSFALTGSRSLPSGSSTDGSYTASFSELEIQSTPGILYPDFPTDYLIQSASIIVNDLISKGIIQS